MQIVRKKLTPTEITPKNVRYNSDCDCVQQTFDGGATWVDSPGADPRISPAFRAPANASADPQCNSAANMVAFLKELIQADLDATTALGLVSTWFGILFLVFPIGIIADILLIIAEVILGIGSAAISSAFTDDVYDILQCIFFANIDPDGQMSDAQLAQIYDDVAAQCDLTVQAVFGAHSSGIGAVGWSNAGALGTITDADCSACIVCFEAAYDFGTGDQFGFALGGLFEDAGTWEGTYWEGHHIDAGFNELVISRQYMDLTEFCAMDLTVSTTHGAAFEIRIYNSDATSYESMGSYGFEAGADHVTHTFVPDVPLEQTDGWLVIIGTTTNFQFMELWSAALGPG